MTETPVAPPCQLRLFGAIDLAGPPGAARLVGQPKPLLLLGFLAVERRHGWQQRDRLAGLFWPELPQGKARGALRAALHRIRDALGEPAIARAGDEAVAVNPAVVASDVDAFHAALEEGALARALELYRGDLLTGVFTDSGELERWLDRERDARRILAADAAWDLAQQYGTAKDMTRAARWARLAARLARADERRIRRVMTLLDAAGDRAAALTVYTDLEQWLRRELDVAPAPETQTLAAAIRTRTA